MPLFGPVNPTLVKEFTANLAQAAATYDLLTATGDALIEDIRWYVSVAGATFTSVSFQTNQTTSYALVSAAEGAVANLTAQKTLTPAAVQILPLKSGQKIQFTLIGATGTGTILAEVRYRPITQNASLA